MSSFHEVQFPPDIAYGAAGGLGYSTSVITTVAGYEKRNANWAAARGRWNVAQGLKNREQVANLIAFFRARKGRAYGFRFSPVQRRSTSTAHRKRRAEASTRRRGW